jgi:hypothetical protein
MCLREAGHTGYPEPRFAEFFRKFPNGRGRRIKQFVFFLGITVEELTMHLRGGNFCSPSEFWDHQEAAECQVICLSTRKESSEQ